MPRAVPEHGLSEGLCFGYSPSNKGRILWCWTCRWFWAWSPRGHVGSSGSAGNRHARTWCLAVPRLPHDGSGDRAPAGAGPGRREGQASSGAWRPTQPLPSPHALTPSRSATPQPLSVHASPGRALIALQPGWSPHSASCSNTSGPTAQGRGAVDQPPVWPAYGSQPRVTTQDAPHRPAQARMSPEMKVPEGTRHSTESVVRPPRSWDPLSSSSLKLTSPLSPHSSFLRITLSSERLVSERCPPSRLS